MTSRWAELEAFANSHRCGTCRDASHLTVRVNRDTRGPQCWCPVCGNTEGFEQRPSLTQQWRRDPDSVPVAVANRLEEKYGGRPMTSQALATIDEPAMLERMSAAKWTNDLPAPERKALAGLAVMYGLDPLMRELVLYQGQPYVTTAALERKAAEHPLWEGSTHRALTAQERKDYGITQAVACEVLVYKKGLRVPSKGIGVADPAQPQNNNPIERREPYRMARSRAMRQALRCFSLGLPFQTVEERGLRVDTASGEILEAAPEVPPDATDADFEAAPPPGPLAETFPDPDGVPDTDASPTGPSEAWKTAEADVQRICREQGRTLQAVQEYWCKQCSCEWADLTLAQLQALGKKLQEPAKK